MVYNQLALWAFHDGQLGDAVEAATAAHRVWVRCVLGHQTCCGLPLVLRRHACAWRCMVMNANSALNFA